MFDLVCRNRIGSPIVSDFITFSNAFMAADLVAYVANSAGTRPPDDVVDTADVFIFIDAFASRSSLRTRLVAGYID